MPKLEKICAIFCNDSDSDIIDYLRQTGCVQTTFIRDSCTLTNGKHITVQYVGGACFSFRKKWLKGINRYIIEYLRQTGCVQTTIIRDSCTLTNGEHITAQYVGGACFSFRKKWLKGINRYIIDYLRQTEYVQTTIIRDSCALTNGKHITAQYVGGAGFSFRKTNGRLS